MSILVKRRKLGGNGIRNWEGEKGKDSAIPVKCTLASIKYAKL